MNRRNFTFAAAMASLAVLLPPPPVPTLKLFRVSDWVFIAAENLQAAIAFHKKMWPGDTEPDDEDSCTYEVDAAHMMVQLEDMLAESGPNALCTTAQEIIDAELAAGSTEAFVVCFDPHYC
jgi:hypothetical protein